MRPKFCCYSTSENKDYHVPQSAWALNISLRGWCQSGCLSHRPPPPPWFLSISLACDSCCRGNVSWRPAGFVLTVMLIHGQMSSKQCSTILLLIILHQTDFVITHVGQENAILLMASLIKRWEVNMAARSGHFKRQRYVSHSLIFRMCFLCVIEKCFIWSRGLEQNTSPPRQRPSPMVSELQIVMSLFGSACVFFSPFCLLNFKQDPQSHSNPHPPTVFLLPSLPFQ